MLETELAYFESHRTEYCEHHAGLFVLIHGEQLWGAFATQDLAYAHGIENIGNVPFLIKRAAPVDELVFLPAYIFGLLTSWVHGTTTS